MASRGVNKVILVGHLGKDPEIRYTTNGTAVATIRLATSESWLDKNGERTERTEWHQVVLWGKLAETASQYLTKGRQAYFEGRLQTREWQDKEGQRRFTTEIVASQMILLGGGGGGGAPGAAGARGGARSETPEYAGIPEDGGAPVGDDDLPF